MFDLKIPETLPFKHQWIIGCVWGMGRGIGLGIGVAMGVVAAHAIGLLK